MIHENLRIPFCRVLCDGHEIAYLREVLESGWLTTGRKALELESRFAEAVHAQYSVAVNSCTAALHLALEAIGIKPGDEVLVPTMTFTASAEVIRYFNAHPVLLDVDYGTCLLTSDTLKEAIAQHHLAKALIVVHYGGQAAPMFGRNGKEGILEICITNSVKIIEDAAHAFPARTNSKIIGGIGDVTCFSFYANKTITAGEGGMLTTNNHAIAERARIMRLHGIDKDVWNRFTSQSPAWEYDVVAPGYKYNMPDVNAAIGLAQLERAEHLREERERCARFYLENLADIDVIDLPVIRENPSDHAWHIFAIVLNDYSPVARNEFIQLMANRGIGTSVHYKPLHRMTYYRDRYKLNPEDFPNAERIWKGCVSLPIYPTLGNDELEYICDCIRKILA